MEQNPPMWHFLLGKKGKCGIAFLSTSLYLGNSGNQEVKDNKTQLSSM